MHPKVYQLAISEKDRSPTRHQNDYQHVPFWEGFPLRINAQFEAELIMKDDEQNGTNMVRCLLVFDLNERLQGSVNL